MKLYHFNKLLFIKALKHRCFDPNTNNTCTNESAQATLVYDTLISNNLRLMLLAQTEIAKLLVSWRKATGVKQASLAHMLGVTQSAISNWETGKDVPSRRFMSRLADVMSSSYEERLRRDQLNIMGQTAIRACFDLDGVKLKMASQGLMKAWPSFSKLQGVRLVEHLVNESAYFLHDEGFIRLARQGEVAMISAVSDRHVQIDVDDIFRHRWTAIFRSYGPKILVDMTYDTCDANSDLGVENVFYYDDLAA
jgi:transcriptional regulator with XRE-family HTH domain